MIDYILVGNGLAGAVLAYRLIGEGKSLLIIDNQDSKAAYRVAGGLWNAITFRKILKGWNADALTEEAHGFYSVLETVLKKKFYTPKQVVRIFSDTAFQNSWYAKSGETEFQDYLSDNGEEAVKSLPIKMPFGCGTVNKAGYVNLDVFMPALQSWLAVKSNRVNETFDYDQLEIKTQSISYKTFDAKAIIFCEGYSVMNNPFFNWLPMRPTKGELLTLKNPGWHFDAILNNGKHLLDKKDGTLSLGATFEWKELNTQTTPEARIALLSHIEKNLDHHPWEIIDQKAGIRPTVSDRRPIAGPHPRFKNLFIYNGLGTKGVLITPWLSKMMSDFLCYQTPLAVEANIDRFVRKYFQ